MYSTGWFPSQKILIRTESILGSNPEYQTEGLNERWSCENPCRNPSSILWNKPWSLGVPKLVCLCHTKKFCNTEPALHSGPFDGEVVDNTLQNLTILGIAGFDWIPTVPLSYGTTWQAGFGIGAIREQTGRETWSSCGPVRCGRCWRGGQSGL